MEVPPAVASHRARQQLRRELDPQLYDEIRELWKRHSIAEEHRDLPGLISTLTEDCVYEIPAWRQRWNGHEGAASFYNGLLTAFPDIHFALTQIVIGPQGVCEEARVTATHARDWLDVAATRRQLQSLRKSDLSIYEVQERVDGLHTQLSDVLATEVVSAGRPKEATPGPTATSSEPASPEPTAAEPPATAAERGTMP